MSELGSIAVTSFSAMRVSKLFQNRPTHLEQHFYSLTIYLLDQMKYIFLLDLLLALPTQLNFDIVEKALQKSTRQHPWTNQVSHHIFYPSNSVIRRVTATNQRYDEIIEEIKAVLQNHYRAFELSQNLKDDLLKIESGPHLDLAQPKFVLKNLPRYFEFGSRISFVQGEALTLNQILGKHKRLVGEIIKKTEKLETVMGVLPKDIKREVDAVLNSNVYDISRTQNLLPLLNEATAQKIMATRIEYENIIDKITEKATYMVLLMYLGKT